MSIICPKVIVVEWLRSYSDLLTVEARRSTSIHPLLMSRTVQLVDPSCCYAIAQALIILSYPRFSSTRLSHFRHMYEHPVAW